MIFRPLAIHETWFLKQMLYQALHVPPGDPPFPPGIVEEPHINKYITCWGSQPNDMAIVCELDEMLIGAIWGRSFSAATPGYGYINDTTPELCMAIKTEYRGNGIGSNLIDIICYYYKKKGVKEVSLSVDITNKAKTLYERKGFIEVAQAGTAVVMKKSL